MRLFLTLLTFMLLTSLATTYNFVVGTGNDINATSPASEKLADSDR